MQVYRSPHNPIITPDDVKPSRDDFKVVCVFNAGVTRYGDETLLLLRVAEKPVSADESVELVPYFDVKTNRIETKAFRKDDPANDFSDPRFVRTPDDQYLSSISHMRLARSRDGIHFTIEDEPALTPDNKYEIYGVEDPRITEINDMYYISYSGISPMGSLICLACTRDFNEYDRLGVIFCPDNRDVEIFPEKISGRYYALHRPNSGEYNRRDVWIAESTDLLNWGNHRHVMSTRNGFWDDGRIGGSAIPIKVDAGWLEIYHGADKNDRYCLGAVLLDAEKPWKVIGRSDQPIIAPEADYEITGFFSNVIFNCGVLLDGDSVKIYYGAADTYICYAEVGLKDILRGIVSC